MEAFTGALHCTTNSEVRHHFVIEWRQKHRQRTIGVALVVCLNIGVDPPDVIKTTPCARVECWVDPFLCPPQKSLATIGARLQRQYEQWQHRAMYKQLLDQTDEDLKKLALGLRRAAKSERVLFHYNGHGVPRPTANGEIWMFNKNYTQYIPVSLYDLHGWLGSPSIYVFDVSSAGLLTATFKKMSLEVSDEFDLIALGACDVNELLPMNPQYPGDIFTACLTTPIEMALKWFASRSLLCQVLPEQVDVPGKHNDRRSPFGELNWIFTAVTDTIAWNVLPQALFQRLFRQDLLVASLFRNFLLAERILRSLNCSPVSIPELPMTHQHPMWDAWDLAAEFLLSQLAKHIKDPSHVFESCSFFSDQLSAFEVWLEFATEDDYPLQLPIVLQVLLSQSHRLRALQLLARFLDLGPKSVNLALSVGIFPYILRLLNSPAAELRNVLVFIWSKILALDRSCRTDLIKEGFHKYFLTHLQGTAGDDLQASLCCFILSVLCEDSRIGQRDVLDNSGLKILAQQLDSPCSVVRRWGALALAKLWENFEPAQLAAMELGITSKLRGLFTDSNVEVRTSAVFSLGLLMAGPSSSHDRIVHDLEVATDMASLVLDGSPMLRSSMVNALVLLVTRDEELFISAAGALDVTSSSNSSEEDLRRHIIAIVLACRHDPFPDIAAMAHELASRINVRGLGSDLAYDAHLEYSVEPLDFYLWNCDFVSRPLLDCNGAMEITSSLEEDYSLGDNELLNERETRDSNNQIVDQAKTLMHEDLAGPVDDQIAVIQTQFDETASLVFHPFQDTIVATNYSHKIGVWRCDGTTLNSFSNDPQLSSQSRVTSLSFINPGYNSMLLCGSDDGCIRLWKNIESSEELVSAWVGIPGMRTGKPGMVIDWQQDRSRMLVFGGGDTKVALWDVNKELSLELRSKAGSFGSVASAVGDSTGDLVFAGCSDGMVRCFDLRDPNLLVASGPVEVDVGLVHTHISRVVQVSLQREGAFGGLLVSGCIRGGVAVHDPRKFADPVYTYDAHTNSPLNALAVHNYAGIVATGSSKQFVNIMQLDGSVINRIKYYDGFLGTRIGSVNCLAFHPHKLLMAAGGRDSLLSIYTVNSHSSTRR